jgi:hypothetical protein
MLRHQRFQTKNSQNPFPVFLLRVILVGFYLSACRYPSVTPTPGIVPTFVTLPPTTSLPTTASPFTSTNTPVIETLTAQASITAVSPTPTCVVPVGWVRYTIRPGDNLFRLGVKTNKTVEEIKLANCLTEDLIFTGDPLYLPFTPPTDIPVPPQPTVIAGCSSSFSCSDSSLPPLVIAPGGPNDPGFKPCSVTKGFPWISVETEKLRSNDLQQGQRAYYFACEFPDPTRLTAQMSGPGGVQTLTVLSAVPNLDLQMHQAQRVVVWNATCDLQTGDNAYTLTISDGSERQAQLTFSLKPSLFQRILTTPYQSGPAGTTFQIYYCGYRAQAGQEVTIDFYYGIKHTNEQEGYDFHHIDSWNILINANGWAMQPLQSVSGDLARPYLLNDREIRFKGYDFLWLVPKN